MADSAVRLLFLAFSLAAFPLNAAERRLGNGALVIVEERPSTETVAVRLVIAGGNLDDSAPWAVARLHAAILLRGARERDAFALARAGEELGGRLTSVSRPMAETVSITVPAENAEPAVRLLVETFLSPRLDREDLEKEKDLLLGALATERDQPSTHRRDAVDHLLFPGHPLERLALPSAEQVRAVAVESLRTFQRGHTQPNRIALLVVGRCSSTRILSLAGELLGTLPGAAASGEIGIAHSVFPTPTPLSADVTKRISKRTTQAELTVALPTAGVTDVERPAFAVLAHILGGFQERLYREIREKRGWAYAIEAAGENFPGAGLFEVTTGAREEYLADIEKLAREELRRITEAPVTPEELTRAVRYLKTAEARRDGTNGGRVGVLTEEILLGSPLRSYEQRVALLESISPADIQALARRLFAGKHVAVVKMY